MCTLASERSSVPPRGGIVERHIGCRERCDAGGGVELMGPAAALVDLPDEIGSEGAGHGVHDLGSALVGGGAVACPHVGHSPAEVDFVVGRRRGDVVVLLQGLDVFVAGVARRLAAPDVLVVVDEVHVLAAREVQELQFRVHVGFLRADVAQVLGQAAFDVPADALEFLVTLVGLDLLVGTEHAAGNSLHSLFGQCQREGGFRGRGKTLDLEFLGYSWEVSQTLINGVRRFDVASESTNMMP